MSCLTALPACSLVGSNVADVPIDLPDKDFTVDTASWQIPDGAAASYLARSCEQAPTACETAAKAACATGCSGACDDDTHTCDLSLAISLYQAIDVAKEQPDVATVGAASSVQVTIDQVTSEVTSNSLDLDTPELTVYVAPASVTAVDSMAVEIGTIATVSAGLTTNPTGLVFTAGGQDALSSAMSAYETPFNIIVGATLVLHAGDPAPTGKLDARIHIAARAGL